MQTSALSKTLQLRGLAKTGKKVATASSFTIVYEKSEGKSIKRSVAKTFFRRNS